MNDTGLVLRKGIYHINLMDAGRRVRLSTHTADARAARKIIAKIRVDLAEGRYFQQAKNDRMLFVDLVERFAQEHKAYRGKAITQGTREAYARAARHVLPAIGGLKLSKVTPERLRDYQSQRLSEGAAPATIHLDMAFISSCFSFAIREGLAEKNPCSAVQGIPLDNKRVRWMTDEEESRLLPVMSPWARNAAVWLLNTGLRRENGLSVKWPDIDLFGRTVRISGECTKNHKPLVIPLNETAFSLIRRLGKVRQIDCEHVFLGFRRRPISGKVFYNVFKKACRRAGIKDLHPHDLRHTFATRLIKRGVSIFAVSRLLGHSSVTMTERYSHISAGDLMADVCTLDAPDCHKFTTREANGFLSH